jgi:hypothetical protein
MSNIALIAKITRPEAAANGTFDSYAWKISKSRRSGLVGSRVSMHTEHNGVSYIQGIINSIRPEMSTGRIIINFTPDSQTVDGAQLPWAQEKAYW